MPALLTERQDQILVLTLNRPEKRNALSTDLLELLERALEHALEDGELRAGIDIGLLFEHLSSNPTGEKIRLTQRRLQNLICRLEELEKPTIAAIEGACVGGGFELALGCDLRVASSEAKFGFPEARIGMFPDLGGISRFPRLVGATVAKEWIFTGRQYSAERAFQLGLLNEITLPGQAKSRALALATELVHSA